MNKYNMQNQNEQTRRGNGKFSTSHRVATPSELNTKFSQQAQNDADQAKQAQVKALGLECDYSEIFA